MQMWQSFESDPHARRVMTDIRQDGKHKTQQTSTPHAQHQPTAQPQVTAKRPQLTQLAATPITTLTHSSPASMSSVSDSASPVSPSSFSPAPGSAFAAPLSQLRQRPTGIAVSVSGLIVPSSSSSSSSSSPPSNTSSSSSSIQSPPPLQAPFSATFGSAFAPKAPAAALTTTHNTIHTR